MLCIVKAFVLSWIVKGKERNGWMSHAALRLAGLLPSLPVRWLWRLDDVIILTSPSAACSGASSDETLKQSRLQYFYKKSKFSHMLTFISSRLKILKKLPHKTTYSYFTRFDNDVNQHVARPRVSLLSLLSRRRWQNSLSHDRVIARSGNHFPFVPS